MGVMLKVWAGYKQGNDIFRPEHGIDVDKELSPIYEDFFELDGVEVVPNFPRCDKKIVEDSYGEKFKIYSIDTILDVIESNITKLNKIPDCIFDVETGKRKGTWKDTRWNDERVQGLIAFLKAIRTTNMKVLLDWA
jgi:hypothetical protein